MFANSRIRVLDITDGSSNTMLVSEQGDWLTTTTGERVDWRPSMLGFIAGTNRTDSPTSPTAFGGPNNNDNRTPNVVTIRYLINYKTGIDGQVHPGGPHRGNFLTGVSTGPGQNLPLRSAHGGGVNALFGDGSVRFLTDTTPLEVLGRLATRDDGETVTLN
jgi:prepilin-type processing-associated H-X9-DG protein